MLDSDRNVLCCAALRFAAVATAACRHKAQTTEKEADGSQQARTAAR